MEVAKFIELKRKLNGIYRYSIENIYELKSIFNAYESLVTKYEDGKSYHTSASIEASEMDGYIEGFMDSKNSEKKRKEDYMYTYNFLVESINEIIQRG